MTLCDTSPVLALVNRRDNDHQVCIEALQTLRSRLITTWPCVTEAMYLLGERVGSRGQEILRGYLENGLISLHVGSEEEMRRICTLMRKYGNMDFADGSLVTAAETLGLTRIFTLDSDFQIYRIHGKTPFDIVP